MIEISDEEVPANALLTLFGFGKTGTFEPPSVKLLEIKLKHINTHECSKRYADYANVDISVVELVGDGHLCTYNEKSQGSCQGDRFEVLRICFDGLIF